MSKKLQPKFYMESFSSNQAPKYPSIYDYPPEVQRQLATLANIIAGLEGHDIQLQLAEYNFKKTQLTESADPVQPLLIELESAKTILRKKLQALKQEAHEILVNTPI